MMMFGKKKKSRVSLSHKKPNFSFVANLPMSYFETEKTKLQEIDKALASRCQIELIEISRLIAILLDLHVETIEQSLELFANDQRYNVLNDLLPTDMHQLFHVMAKQLLNLPFAKRFNLKEEQRAIDNNNVTVPLNLLICPDHTQIMTQSTLFPKTRSE